MNPPSRTGATPTGCTLSGNVQFVDFKIQFPLFPLIPLLPHPIPHELLCDRQIRPYRRLYRGGRKMVGIVGGMGVGVHPEQLVAQEHLGLSGSSTVGQSIFFPVLAWRLQTR
jgi:hypothetical protein